jgi:hypothetical protein
MDRTHQSLAAVGVAALVRLINSAAPHMDAAAWMLATNFLMSTSQVVRVDWCLSEVSAAVLLNKTQVPPS